MRSRVIVQPVSIAHFTSGPWTLVVRNLRPSNFFRKTFWYVENDSTAENGKGLVVKCPMETGYIIICSITNAREIKQSASRKTTVSL